MIDSIRTRLTLWNVGVSALMIVAFASLTYFLVGRALAKETDETLAEMGRNFQIALEAERGDETEKTSVETDLTEAVNESRFRDYIFQVSAADGRLISTTAPAADLAAILSKRKDSSFETLRVGGESFRVFHLPLTASGGEQYDLYIARSLADRNNFLSRLRYIFFVAVPLTLLLTGLSGYFLARKSLAPVALMSRQAARIGAENLQKRLPVKNERDELGNLAQVFNALLTRLENSFEQQRRFMADASHELRTPLAIVRGESEIALSKEQRPNEELRESLIIVHDESRRLTKIVEDLFTLARADSGHFKTNFKEIYLDEILAECVRAVRVLAEKRNVALNIAVSPEMPMRGDEELLRRLFVNLLDNAIKYNRESGAVSVTAEKDSEHYRLTISDTGAGVSKEARAKIFERFYRADQARSRNLETTTSGAGLGLAIAQWIAALHNGVIELVSSDETGSIFSVSFPVQTSEN